MMVNSIMNPCIMMTLNITLLRSKAFRTMTLNMMAISIMTLSVMTTLNITLLRFKKFSKKHSA
jgi:hypothetical protein